MLSFFSQEVSFVGKIALLIPLRRLTKLVQKPQIFKPQKEAKDRIVGKEEAKDTIDGKERQQWEILLKMKT